MHPDRTIRGILFLSCLFVCLLSTLTFAINFEPLEVETSYFLLCFMLMHLCSLNISVYFILFSFQANPADE